MSAENLESRESRSTVEARTVTTVKEGVKPFLILGALLFVLGVFWLFEPMNFATNAGMLKCGSVISGPDSDFGQKICSGVTTENLYKAIASFVGAVIVPAMAVVLYGSDHSTETRKDS
jgi:hypothetical protein